MPIKLEDEAKAVCALVDAMRAAADPVCALELAQLWTEVDAMLELATALQRGELVLELEQAWSKLDALAAILEDGSDRKPAAIAAPLQDELAAGENFRSEAENGKTGL